jgi:hypothetical protein
LHPLEVVAEVAEVTGVEEEVMVGEEASAVEVTAEASAAEALAAEALAAEDTSEASVEGGSA